MNKKTFYTVKLLANVLVIALFFSCKKSSNENLIPNVPVSFTVYLSLPQYVSLNNITGHVVVTEYGYRGVVVYRKSIDEFVAFDLACPYDPTADGAKLVVDTSGLSTTDPHCGSKFDLTSNGSVLHGPSTRPMKQYFTSYDANANSVYVSN